MNVSRPNRVTRAYTQRLVASPSVVFALLCPVRETDWIAGWDPIEVMSDSGLAEPDCVFVTSATPHNAVWYVTRHEPANGFVEMLKVSPNLTACRLSISLAATATGCDALVRYTHTSLGPEGDAFVAAFTEEFYLGFMRDWEDRLNHFLTSGARLG